MGSHSHLRKQSIYKSTQNAHNLHNFVRVFLAHHWQLLFGTNTYTNTHVRAIVFGKWGDIVLMRGWQIGFLFRLKEKFRSKQKQKQKRHSQQLTVTLFWWPVSLHRFIFTFAFISFVTLLLQLLLLLFQSLFKIICFFLLWMAIFLFLSSIVVVYTSTKFIYHFVAIQLFTFAVWSARRCTCTHNIQNSSPHGYSCFYFLQIHFRYRWIENYFPNVIRHTHNFKTIKIFE